MSNTKIVRHSSCEIHCVSYYKGKTNLFQVFARKISTATGIRLGYIEASGTYFGQAEYYIDIFVICDLSYSELFEDERCRPCIKLKGLQYLTFPEY